MNSVQRVGCWNFPKKTKMLDVGMRKILMSPLLNIFFNEMLTSVVGVSFYKRLSNDVLKIKIFNFFKK